MFISTCEIRLDTMVSTLLGCEPWHRCPFMLSWPGKLGIECHRHARQDDSGQLDRKQQSFTRTITLSVWLGLAMAVGEIVPEVLCVVCRVPMVLRRRRDGTAFFLGCGNFAGSRSCKFTMELDQALVESRAHGKRRSFTRCLGERLLCCPWTPCRPGEFRDR